MNSSAPESAFRIRAARVSDVAGMLAIEQRSFSDPWTQTMLETDLQQAQSFYFVAEDCRPEETGFAPKCTPASGRILGYAGYWQVLDEGHIMNIAVDPAYRRQHVGDELLDAMQKDGAKRGILYWTLEVRVSNKTAKALYEKHGFQSAGIRPGYYSDPKEDAEIYWLR